MMDIYVLLLNLIKQNLILSSDLKTESIIVQLSRNTDKVNIHTFSNLDKEITLHLKTIKKFIFNEIDLAEIKSVITEGLKDMEKEYYEEYFNHLISTFYKRYDFLHTILIKEKLKLSSYYNIELNLRK
jgi:hypothetical protein